MKTKDKKKWRVTLKFSSTVSHNVEAGTKDEAIQIAKEWTNGNLLAINAETESTEARQL